MCLCLLQCLCCDCVLRGYMHVCECVCVYGWCVVFVCVSGHVCNVIACVYVGVCMFVGVCACMVIVLCLYASPAVLVWCLCVCWVYT